MRLQITPQVSCCKQAMYLRCADENGKGQLRQVASRRYRIFKAWFCENIKKG
ncbi:hypothetical protein WEU38_18225 (plasmid) [Cyanobacterium aponinum AL20118]|uniref:hypothetical protein n=1 Tax=Cyanobacterium aponinum TaxID=379064 RepID=UPI0032541E65